MFGTQMLLLAALRRRGFPCTPAIAYKSHQARTRLKGVVTSFCFCRIFHPFQPQISDPHHVVHAYRLAASRGLSIGTLDYRRQPICTLNWSDDQLDAAQPSLRRRTFFSALRTHISPSDGKRVHSSMLYCGFERDTFLVNLLLSLYGKCGDLDSARFVFENMHQLNVVSFNAMIAAYTRCGALGDARTVFDDMLERNVVSWNSLIAAYTHHGHGGQALCLYRRMQQEGENPNDVTFVNLLSACASLEVLLEGQALHVQLNGLGLESNLNVGTALVYMYGKCRALNAVHSVFGQLEQHDVVSWTALISTYAQQGHWKQALTSFIQMQQEGVVPNKVTFISILSACASLCSLFDGKLLHVCTSSVGFKPDTDVRSALINMYGKCGSIDHAWLIFDSSSTQDVILWNAMIAACIQQGQHQQALQLFRQMQKRRLNPNELTLASILTACAGLTALKEAVFIHAHLVDEGYELDTVVENALINMYGKCKALENARSVFEKMASCNVVSWTSLIAAYSEEGHDKEALEIFQKMQQKGVKPNEVTFISILCACVSLGALEVGRAIHACIADNGITSTVGNAIVNMYGKCGALEDARAMFDQLPLRDVFSWNVMMAAYAQGGHGKEALLYFREMQREGMKPTDITFVSLLSACSHAGMVDEGCFYFVFMSENYGIPQMLEHHACIIDLFGRAGQLEKAESLVYTLSLATDACLGCSLLASCRIHGDLDRGRHAAEHVLEVNPQIMAPYVLLSNIMLQERASH